MSDNTPIQPKTFTPPEALDEVHCVAYGMKEYDSNTITAELVLEETLKDFEWLKTKLNITFLNSLTDPEDKMRIVKILTGANDVCL